jgi:hypothetical protein
LYPSPHDGWTHSWHSRGVLPRLRPCHYVDRVVQPQVCSGRLPSRPAGPDAGPSGGVRTAAACPATPTVATETPFASFAVPLCHAGVGGLDSGWSDGDVRAGWDPYHAGGPETEAGGRSELPADLDVRARRTDDCGREGSRIGWINGCAQPHVVGQATVTRSPPLFRFEPHQGRTAPRLRRGKPWNPSI